MKRTIAPSGKYSVIEITLCGRDLRIKEKVSARELLLSCRISERNIVLSDYQGAFRVSCYTRSIKKVREVKRRYKTWDLRGPLALKVKRLGWHDWFDKWKQDYRIGPLGVRFMIVPVWKRHEFKSDGRRTPIYLEPGSAFGSGYHETTRLIARFLELLAGKVVSFLDIGCGTGILSVVAAKLGAAKVTGYDNDKPAVLVARRNFRRNQCKNGIFFYAQLKRSKISGHFDTVGANLLSKTLLEHRQRIIARVRAGGHLLVSGIAIQNFPAFRREFSRAPLRCLKILRGRRWVAVLYKKKCQSIKVSRC